MKRKLSFLLLASLLAAEETTAPKSIPAELYAEVYRAQAQLLAAQKTLDAALTAVVEFCGESAHPSIDMADARKNVCLARK